MNSNEIWQAEVNGQIYDAEFSELASWIGDNALLPNDKVRRGNLRWLEAGKIPALIPFFNAKESGTEPPNISATDAENKEREVQIQTSNFTPPEPASEQTEQTFSEAGIFHEEPPFIEENEPLAVEFCVLHNDAEARFVCETCFNNFCKACPEDFGSIGKTCPMCGALVKTVVRQTEVYRADETPEFSDQEFFSPGKFDFADFGKALFYPFKYKTSLFFGALMFMFFTLGQQAYAMGGIFMIFSAIFSLMLANMLTFGILANTVENFSQWKTDANFMPEFDDFSLLDDVVHPFFLSIGAYIVSFGLFFVIVLGGVWYTISSVQNEMPKAPQNSASTMIPGMSGDMRQEQNAPQIAKSAQDFKQQIEQVRTGTTNPANEEQQFQDLQKMIEDSRRARIESVTGPTPEQEQAQTREFLRKMLKVGLPLVIFGGLAFLWGLFYFPAACAVAGYTRSFAATINPSVGLDTIKRLGRDYFKILLMSFLISLVSAIAGVILKTVFSAFDMPGVGNIPAIAVGSFVTFYLWTVFSCVLGYAIYKNSDKLGIYRG